MPSKRRKYRPSDKYRGDWDSDDLAEWLRAFEDQANLDLRPVKSSISAEEILHAVIAHLTSPDSPCSMSRLVGNQCQVDAGEAPLNELTRAVNSPTSLCWDGAVLQVVEHASLRVENHWPWHPLRFREWQPNGAGKPWFLVRLAREDELEDEDREFARHQEMVRAMDAEPDPEAGEDDWRGRVPLSGPF